MADKMHHTPADKAAQKSSWLDGLPHDFSGWGPQTPDPEEARAGEIFFVPENGLTWRGDEDHNLHVWRFDGRRHHHH